MTSKFEVLNTMQESGNKEGYYLEGLAMMHRSVIRRLTGYGYHIEDYEDLKQQISTELWDLIQSMETIKYKEPIIKYKQEGIYNTITDTIKIEQVPVEVYEQVSVQWNEAPANIVYHQLVSKCIDKLYKYFNTKSINHCISIDSTQQEYGLADFSDKAMASIEIIEDLAARLDFTYAETIESIKGTLTAGEYNFLIKWYSEGVKPYKDNKMTVRIREKIQDLGIEEVGHALARLKIEELDKLNTKLYKITR